MAGMSDLGGVKFFNLAVETPEGDIEVLELVMQGEQQGAGRCGALLRQHALPQQQLSHPLSWLLSRQA